MTDEAGLIGLLHRADWTRLSLAAEVSDGSTVLVAPGKRYRYQGAGHATGCDGGRPWELPGEDEDDTDGGRVHWISGPKPPLPRLLCPSWLLERSRLEVRGRVRACGRDALEVVMTGRPAAADETGPADDPSGPVTVLVDAESGILLRVAGLGEDEPAGVIELVCADFDPVIDEAQFAPPPESRRAEGAGDSLAALGPAWAVAKTAGGLAAGALGAWIKYSPRRDRSRPSAGGDDPEPAMPGDERGPELSPEGIPAGPPCADELLQRLHAGGPDAFTATLHHWTDAGALAAATPAGARRAGFGGLGLLTDAISEQPAVVHLVSRVRVAGPLRYQIDQADPGRWGPATIACDGQQSWNVYADRITTGPAEPLPGDIRGLADPSWLLLCRLAFGSMTTVSSRAAFLVSVARRRGEWPLPLLFPSTAAIAVIDAELGLIVRLTSYLGGRPVHRYELRDVRNARR